MTVTSVETMALIQILATGYTGFTKGRPMRTRAQSTVFLASHWMATSGCVRDRATRVTKRTPIRAGGLPAVGG